MKKVEMNEETTYWVAFSVFPGIGPVRFALLRNYFGTAKAAWEAPTEVLRKIKLGEKLTSQFDHFRKTFDLDDYLKKLEKQHIAVLILTDFRYPKLLKQLTDAPFVLYIKSKPGMEKLNLDRTIGVVGTRKITHYGEDVTKKLVEGLVSYGFTIISGLAYGVDAVAHQAAIEAGGKTIAVLGCGIDIIAPPSNARLYHEIAEQGYGAIVSEMPLGLRPNKGLFPARNRIISGLSLGVVVTEGADDSGALITARNASEQGREVFAVPGPITSLYSKGPAKLIKNGAKLVENVEDILEELGIASSKTYKNKLEHDFVGKGRRELTDGTQEEKKILKCLIDRNMHVDELVRSTGLTIPVVGATITILEMKGIVKDYGEKVYGLV